MTWPALENVTDLCDMTRFIQTLDMCAFRAKVTRLLWDVLAPILSCAAIRFCIVSDF
jgi:hypothetical protein